MPVDLVELYDYLIHEGQIDGQTACALLWTGSDWPYQSAAHVRSQHGAGGFRDLLIEAGEGRLLLKSMDKRLLKLICENGLYIIYQDAAGRTCHSHIPPCEQGE